MRGSMHTEFLTAHYRSLALCLTMLSFILLAATTAQADHHAITPKPENVLVFGLLPSESPVSKFRRYAPLRDYLAKHLGTSIILETARNFPEFRKRTGERRYDFLETAPHFVLPAVDSGKYTVITTIVQPLSAQVVVKSDSRHKSLGDLAGKTIATPAPQAIITKIGKDVLMQHKLVEGKNVTYKNYKTHNAAYEAVLGGQADAALISINIFNKARKKNEPLRSIGASEDFPNMSIMVASDLPAKYRSSIRSLLVEMADHEEGRKILKKITYPGYRTTNIGEFNSLRGYLKSE